LISRLNKDWRPENIKIKKAGGQTNRNYIVQYKNKKFFVRLPWESDVINRKIEGKNILALSKNKKLKEILPRYYVYILNKRNILDSWGQKIFNLPDGTMMTEYIEGKLFSPDLFKKKRYQEKLAKMFCVFHKSKVNFVNNYNVFRDELAKYRIIVEKHGTPKFIDKKTVISLKKIEIEAKKRIPLLKKGVPAHNDFIFQNFLIGKNGKLYLLDFEYAGMNKKGGHLYDFAFLFADNLFRQPAMNKKMFEQFLKIANRIYVQRLNKEQIYWLSLAVPVMQVWWGTLRYFDVSTKKEKKYFKDYVLKRTKKIGKLFEFIKKGVRRT